MKNNRRAMLAVFLAAGSLFFPPSLRAELPIALSGLFPAAQAALLEKRGELSGVFKENEKLRHLPRLPFAEAIEEGAAAVRPMFGVEVCVLHRAPGAKTDTEEAKRAIYNTLSGISTLKGLKYYSESRKIMRELFIDAYRVAGLDDRRRLPDLFFDEDLPPSRRVYAYQHDSSFGENVYLVDYRFESGAFLMRMENASLIWYGILPLIDPGKLVYYVLIYPAGEYVLFYSLVCVNGANPFGIMESRMKSFYNRIKALDGWFQKQSGMV